MSCRGVRWGVPKAASIHPRVPTEVCERIISFIPDYDFMARFGSLDRWSRWALMDCCQVCRSWVPTSQRLLFAAVELQRSNNALTFIGIVTRSPSIRPWVESLTIWPLDTVTPSSAIFDVGDSELEESRGLIIETPRPIQSNPTCNHNWIYKVLTTLPPVLTNLHWLRLHHLPPLHPTSIPLISRFGNVQRLDLLKLHSLSFREIIRLVNSFPKLQSLYLDICEWKQPASFYARKRPHLLSIHIRPPSDTPRPTISQIG